MGLLSATRTERRSRLPYYERESSSSSSKVEIEIPEGRKKMSPRCRTSIAFGFVFGVLLGSALVIYLKLWTIDSTFSSHDRELLRKEFDHANMEAMDESAEWRMKYDAEVERMGQCKEELERVKATSSKLEALQKENTLLHGQLESLIHSKDFQCNCNGSSTSV